jgi:hypothetical protein
MRYVKNSLTQPDKYARSVSFPSGVHIFWTVSDSDAVAFTYGVERPGQRAVVKEFQRRGERAWLNQVADALVDAEKGVLG